MSDFTNAYVDLLIRQYWEKPNARAEVEAIASGWDAVNEIVKAFSVEFDLDQARGVQLDVIGKIVGLDRRIPFAVAKEFFGFDDNPDATGFDNKFAPIADLSYFYSKFSPAYTDLELEDSDYIQFLKLKIAQNATSAFMVSDNRISIQEVINDAFNGEAYVTDRQNMSLALFVTTEISTAKIISIYQAGLLPKPQGVRYASIVQLSPGETFGFSDNADSLGFGDKFDAGITGGIFANKVLI